MTTVTDSIEQAVGVLRAGGVIAYPTESCFGLGCDPLNSAAVNRILSIKRRPVEMGVIVIADDIAKLQPLLEPLTEEIYDKLCKTWPGPNTWLCPVSKDTPAILSGSHATLAVRVTAHPTAAALCRLLDSAIVSTSANVTSKPSLLTAHTVVEEFDGQIDLVLDQPLGGDPTPSTIRHAITGETVRP